MTQAQTPEPAGLATPSRPRCADCKFFIKIGETGTYCQRFPPQMYLPRDKDTPRSLFPYVNKETWCGEFSRKD